ncbi:hypothetical protein D3C85_1665710 [compost metagenome]
MASLMSSRLSMVGVQVGRVLRFGIWGGPLARIAARARLLQGAELAGGLEFRGEAVAQLVGHAGLLGDDYQAFCFLRAVGNGAAGGFECAFTLGSAELRPGDEADFR